MSSPDFTKFMYVKAVEGGFLNYFSSARKSTLCYVFSIHKCKQNNQQMPNQASKITDGCLLGRSIQKRKTIMASNIAVKKDKKK